MRDLTAGAAILSAAVFAHQLSEACFTAVLWFGQVTGHDRLTPDRAAVAFSASRGRLIS